MPIAVEGLVTVTLDFTRGNNTNSQGSVSFAPPRFIVDDTVVTPRSVQASVVDSLGSIKLIPVDGGTYRVTEKLDNIPPREYNVNIPTSAAGQTIKLKDLAPVNPLIPGVAQNTLRSGFIQPNNSVGVDGDYYYDISAHMWYGPKANGAWPAGFSLVGPAGGDGDPGKDGDPGPTGRGIASSAIVGTNLVLTYTDAATVDVGNVVGPKGNPGPAGSVKTSDQYFVAGNISPLPSTAGLWVPLSIEQSIAAVDGDRIKVSIHGMRNAANNVYLDAGVITGNSPKVIRRYLATGTDQPAPEGDTGFYMASGFINQSATRKFVVQPSYIDTGVVRVAMLCNGNGTGILYSSAGYPFYILLENIGPEPA